MSCNAGYSCSGSVVDPLDIYDALKRLPFHHYYCSLGQLISLQASESSDFLEVMNLFLKMSYLKILIFQLFLTLTLCWL